MAADEMGAESLPHDRIVNTGFDRTDISENCIRSHMRRDEREIVGVAADGCTEKNPVTVPERVVDG